jgi:hypothetical protein
MLFSHDRNRIIGYPNLSVSKIYEYILVFISKGPNLNKLKYKTQIVGHDRIPTPYIRGYLVEGILVIVIISLLRLLWGSPRYRTLGPNDGV